MNTTIKYIIEHPEEFNIEDNVIVIGKIPTTTTDNATSSSKKRTRQNMRHQFELFGKLNTNGKYDKIPISEFEKLKKITGIMAEDKTISYQVDYIWFVTGSQNVLDKVNANYHTSLSFGSFENLRDAIPNAYKYED